MDKAEGLEGQDIAMGCLGESSRLCFVSGSGTSCAGSRTRLGLKPFSPYHAGPFL